MSITYEQAIDGQMRIMARLGRVLVWSLVAVAHLALFFALLFIFWWLGISPASINSWIEGFFASMLGQGIGLAFGIFGVSLAAVLFAYAKICHWAISKWLTSYIFKGFGSKA